jgi:hypothetical protein
MKEDQETTSNERKPQGIASGTASEVRAATGKKSAKRKGEEKERPKSDRPSHAVSAGQRK